MPEKEFLRYLDESKWESVPDEFVVFDLETTGLTPQTDRIVEIGAILFRKELYLRSGEVENFQCFVKQIAPIPKDAIGIHGITDAMVKDGESEYAALTKLFQFVDGRPVYAYNAKFDTDFLKATAKRCDYFDENFRLEVTDVMPLVRDVFNDLPDRKLLTVAKRIGHPVTQAHRALDDCAMTLNVFVHCQQKLRARDSIELRETYLDLGRKTKELEEKMQVQNNGKTDEDNKQILFVVGLMFVLGIFFLLKK